MNHYIAETKEITTKHVSASKEIISIAEEFEKDPKTAKAGSLIRSLQLLEKEKLMKVHFKINNFPGI